MFLFFAAPWFVHLLFGSKYNLAGQVLKEISPLFVSISLMRLTDMIMLSLDLVRQSMLVNVAVSISMLLLMLSVPASEPLSLLLAIVVGAQFAQATISGTLIASTLRRRFV